VRIYSAMLAIGTAIAAVPFPASAELGSNVPPNDDMTLLMQREIEVGTSGSGIFDIPVPDPTQTYQPAERVKRDKLEHHLHSIQCRSLVGSAPTFLRLSVAAVPQGSGLPNPPTLANTR
jgi:hypothetical protein